MNSFVVKPDPALDLVLVRHSPVPPELVWNAYTTPDLLEQWFCPRPYKAVEWQIGLFPGGAFSSVIMSPEGDRFPGNGCILEATVNRRLIFTSTMSAGFPPNPPAPPDSFVFTAIIDIEPNGTGSTYTATAMHPDPEAKNRQESMGFHNGWNTAYDQLIELMSP